MEDPVSLLQAEADALLVALLSGVGLIQQFADQNRSAQSNHEGGEIGPLAALNQAPVDPAIPTNREDLLKQLIAGVVERKERILALIEELPDRDVSPAEHLAELKSLDEEHQQLTQSLREKVAAAESTLEDLQLAQEDLVAPVAAQFGL